MKKRQQEVNIGYGGWDKGGNWTDPLLIKGNFSPMHLASVQLQRGIQRLYIPGQIARYL
jgi:hypothetical protein